MGLINKFIENISKIDELSKFKPYEVHISTSKHNFKTEEEILENIIKGRDRLSETGLINKINFRLHSVGMNRIIFNATLQEFPNCCGKLIMHSIRLSNMNYFGGDLIVWSDDTGSLILTNVLDLVKDISEVLHYSSTDFIISDVEQPFLLSSFRKTGLKEVSSFKNRRNNYKHTCYTFSVNFPEVTEFKGSSITQQAIAQ